MCPLYWVTNNQKVISEDTSVSICQKSGEDVKRLKSRCGPDYFSCPLPFEDLNRKWSQALPVWEEFILCETITKAPLPLLTSARECSQLPENQPQFLCWRPLSIFSSLYFMALSTKRSQAPSGESPHLTGASQASPTPGLIEQLVKRSL